MDTLRQDLRHAIRRLTKSPGFTAVAVLTLALGIGATAAIFSVVNGVLLKPLPFARPAQLVGIFHIWEGRRTTMSGPNFWDLKKQSQTLADAAAFSRDRTILTGQGEPVRLDGAEVTGSFFDVLGARPLWGRTFREDDNEPGKPRIVVLSYGLWQQRFGGRPDAIGKKIMLNGVSTEIVGVMPAAFAYPTGRVLWTPIEYSPNFISGQRGAWYLTAIGRARTGIPPEQVTAEVQTIGKQLATKYPDANAGLDFTAVPLLEAMVGDIRRAVLMLLGAVGFVLLIACVNVANLLLARAAARESEMAVRTALGAGRGRLVRQLLTESVMLGLLGAGFGLLFAVWGVEILIGMQPQGIPRLDAVSVDRTVVMFAVSLAALTGLIFGLVPAMQSTRAAVAGTPRAGGEVIGIIGDVKEAGLNQADPPQLYLPYRQWPVQGMALVLKTSVPPQSVADAARREVYAVDPALPVANVRTLEQVVSRSI